MTQDVDSVWDIVEHADVKAPHDYNDWPDGIHYFKDGFYRKRVDGRWFVKHRLYYKALRETKLSIHQDIKHN